MKSRPHNAAVFLYCVIYLVIYGFINFPEYVHRTVFDVSSMELPVSNTGVAAPIVYFVSWPNSWILA